MEDNLKQKFLPDEYIFKQGEKGNKAYLLLDGRIAIEVNGKKVSEISEMEIFGEMSLILKTLAQVNLIIKMQKIL